MQPYVCLYDLTIVSACQKNDRNPADCQSDLISCQFLLPIIISLLNNSMKEQDYAIQRKQAADDKQREIWLKQNGLNDRGLTELPLVLLQAQRIATHMLKENGRYLEQNQAQTLNNFLQAMRNRNKSKQLTEAQAYKILNIGKQVNRQLFKAHKAIK